MGTQGLQVEEGVGGLVGEMAEVEDVVVVMEAVEVEADVEQTKCGYRRMAFWDMVYPKIDCDYI